MAKKTVPESASLVPANEVVIARIVDAPRELVFDAFTRPEHLSAWWGPRGLTADCQLDARVGGAYRITMHSPDGHAYPMKGVYLEVQRPERIVYTVDLSEHPVDWFATLNGFRSSDAPLGDQRVTVTFESVGKKTALEIRTRFESADVRDAFLKLGMAHGWGQSLDKLEARLTLDRSFTVERVVDAPIALAFSVWTEPRHLIKWWGPNGFTNTFHEISVEPGGVWRFNMHGPDGIDYPNLIQFIEVVPPSGAAYQSARLVYRHGTEDPNDPGQFMSTVTFDALGPGAARTRITMRGTFLTAAAFDVVKPFALPGGQQTLSKMEALLSTLMASN